MEMQDSTRDSFSEEVSVSMMSLIIGTEGQINSQHKTDEPRGSKRAVVAPILV